MNAREAGDDKPKSDLLGRLYTVKAQMLLAIDNPHESHQRESIEAFEKAIEVYKSRPEDYSELISKLEQFIQTSKLALAEDEEMFHRRQTTEDYRMTSHAESDEEDNYDDSKANASMSRTTIGIIGGMMAMISAFTFYKASQN